MIVDAHNDLLIELWLRSPERNPFGQLWLPHLQRGGVGVQVCPISSDERVFPGAGLQQALLQAAAFHRAVRENPEHAVHVRSAADLDAALDSRRVGMVLAMEGAEPFGRSVELADAFVDLGVRMVGLTWQYRTFAADGDTEPGRGGLSAFGREVVERLVERGVILDLAHTSPGTFDEMLELVADKGGSVIVSHVGCRALCDVPRNLSDDQLRAVGAAGGVVAIGGNPYLLGLDDRSTRRMVQHIAHAVDVAGADHVAIGSDFSVQLARANVVAVPPHILDSLPPGVTIDTGLDDLEGPQDYGNLEARLRESDLTAEQVDGVLSANMLRLLRRELR